MGRINDCVVLRIPPENGRYRKEAEEIIKEFRKRGIDFEPYYSNDPDAMPAIAFTHNPYAWEFVGRKEIQHFIERWEEFWRDYLYRPKEEGKEK
jgi:hypothetical protein